MGPSIIGFGTYHFRYESAQEGEMCRVDFSPRAAQLVRNVGGFDGNEALLSRLGKHKTGKACLYIDKLADVDLGVLEEIVVASFAASGNAKGCSLC